MKQNTKRLGQENISKLLFTLSVPAIIGMMVQAFYNVVDTLFVGNGVGMLAIGGIAIAFPIQLIIMSIAQMFGIGGASIISRSLGEGNTEKAEKTMGNVFSLVFISSALITWLGSVYIVPLLKLFGATENILPYSVEYMKVILLGTVFFSFAMASNNIIRSEGNAKVAMGSMLISGGLNIILDPIFIFVLDMGIEGAAIATVLSQAVTVFYILYYFIAAKSEVKFKWKNLKIDLNISKEIFTIGLPSFTRQIAGSIMAIVINNSLAVYGGDVAISAFGVINRLLSLIFMPIFGIVQGLQPIAGYNYGARQYNRVINSVKLALVWATVLSVIGFVMLMVFPGQIISFFNQQKELIETGSYATRIIVAVLPLVGFQIVGASVFQAIGKALPSLVLSMSRQILFLIPLVLILPLFFKLSGVFMAFPMADTLSFVITFVMLVRQMKEFETWSGNNI